MISETTNANIIKELQLACTHVIDALQKNENVPSSLIVWNTSDLFPDNSRDVLVVIEEGGEAFYTCVGWALHNKWIINNHVSYSKVVAWAEMPKYDKGN